MIKKITKFALWTLLAIVLFIGGLFLFAILGRPLEHLQESYATESIEHLGSVGTVWGDQTNLGQVDAFGFNLKDKYGMEYLIGVEDGLVDPVSIHIYQVNKSHIETIRDLFKSHDKYRADLNFRPLCNHNRYSEKRIKETEEYVNAHCKTDGTSSADCVALATFDTDDYRNRICLFDKYLEFYWGEM